MNKSVAIVAALILGGLAFVPRSAAETPDGWVDDVEVAFSQAKKENKSLLLLFTGSDFCPPCIVMEKKVFSKEDFVERATEEFVLVFIDFPESDPALEKANRKYYEKYQVEGYPTVILMDPEENEFGRFSAIDYPGVEPFLEKMDVLKERSELD